MGRVGKSWKRCINVIYILLKKTFIKRNVELSNLLFDSAGFDKVLKAI